ncbi:hypothetical protein EB796_023265 [Bugula neritina]|uniref:Uncharacterized protein n=1 Tax=Bugula neritina TaxID=10212 RepID=A0A7J7IWW7_BUGNE|nr:hypothetical protein EB796_023265 [Bugula neritina]
MILCFLCVNPSLSCSTKMKTYGFLYSLPQECLGFFCVFLLIANLTYFLTLINCFFKYSHSVQHNKESVVLSYWKSAARFCWNNGYLLSAYSLQYQTIWSRYPIPYLTIIFNEVTTMHTCCRIVDECNQDRWGGKLKTYGFLYSLPQECLGFFCVFLLIANLTNFLTLVIICKIR